MSDAKQRDVLMIGDGSKENVRTIANELEDWICDCCRLIGVDLEGKRDLTETEADVIISLGGDGEILRVVRRLEANQIPVLGVNLGKLGFLNTVETDEMKEVLPDLLKRQELDTTRRLRLELTLDRENGASKRFVALNDFVITRGGISRMVTLEVFINDERTTVYDGDGLIISTPTGSTAHNLSAGGPVIEPGVQGIVLTPLAAHTLTIRPLVISAERTVHVRIRSTPEQAVLTVDGQEFTNLNEGDRLEIQDCRPPARLVSPPDRSFYKTLHQKLQWGKTPKEQTDI